VPSIRGKAELSRLHSRQMYPMHRERRHHPHYRSHQHRLRCRRRHLPNRPTYTTHTQSIRVRPEYHPRSSVQSSSCCSDRTTRCAQRKARLAWVLESRRSTDHISANTSPCRRTMGAGGEPRRDEGPANRQSRSGGGSARGTKGGS
jgi:hypothetical protein